MAWAALVARGARGAISAWDLARELRGRISLDELRSGAWFDRVLAAVLALQEEIPEDGNAAQGPAAGRDRARAIRRATVRAGLSGAGAATASTIAAALTFDTEGVAAIVALPAAAASIAGDLIYRTFVQLRLGCEIARTLGVRFGRDDAAELTLLCAAVLDGEPSRDDGALHGRRRIERLVRLDAPTMGAAVGSHLGRDALLRNGVPYLGLIASPVASWRLTRRLGRMVGTYASLRCALEPALAAARGDGADVLDDLIEGAWFVFLAKGRVVSAEAALLARLLRSREPADRRESLLRLLVADASGWLKRLGELRREAGSGLLHTLVDCAAVNGVVSGAQQELLGRAAEALQQPFERERLIQRASEYAHF